MHQVIDQETGLIVTDDQQIMRMSEVQMFLATTPPIDHVRELEDRLEAYQAYYKDDVPKYNEITISLIHTGRYIGATLAELPKNNGTRLSPGGNRVLPPGDPTPTLADRHISKMQSSRYQQLAAIPEAIVERYITARIQAVERIIKADLLTDSKIANPLRLRKKRDEHDAQARSEPTKPTVELAPWSAWLPEQPDCDLLLTDPPYSTDVDDIAAFASEWLPIALAAVKPTGRAYVCIGAYPDELRAYLNADRADMTLAQVLVWTYRNTLGPTPKDDYKLNWQAILYFRGADAPPLDCPTLNEQWSVQDVNAPDGRLGNRYHAWQKPIELAERLIRHSTKPGDLILDPFAGTGTFLLAGAKLGREARGCDIDEAMLGIAMQRGCDIAK